MPWYRVSKRFVEGLSPLPDLDSTEPYHAIEMTDSFFVLSNESLDFPILTMSEVESEGIDFDRTITGG